MFGFVRRLFRKRKSDVEVVQDLMKEAVDLMLKHGPDSRELADFVGRHNDNVEFVRLITQARRLKKSAQAHA
jgi:hypothetical protein